MENKIPTHDPYTGELNPYYEELTGEKNPLISDNKDNNYCAKLIKDEDGYSLFTREENSTNRKFIATTQGMYVDHKLSKENCDEIFGVVDVNSEVESIVKTICPDDRGKDVIYGTGMAVGIQCFKKVIELNKDKVFTLEDVRKAFNKGYLMKFNPSDEYHETLNNLVKSLQQPTEIEVEIEMECLDPNCDGINKKGVCITTGKPKLDEEGCLILKKL